MSKPLTECIEYGNPRGPVCSGEIHIYHSTLGTPIFRCTPHFDEHLDRQDRINRDYPDSPYGP